ncbi:MAG: HupE/UreJ family protein [Saprospiraceae bacterium]|nr:HupE/UreJ family protein [Saprospiraceae bacterium]
METFRVYLQLGFEHIADFKGYDHILFIVALCAVYPLKAWKKVALLATAFTLGHSLTLALAVLDIVRIPAATVEFLIPITILLTAFYNAVSPENYEQSGLWTRRAGAHYALAGTFGLIHGMGFSNFLRAMLLPGEENELGLQLLAFNLGVEVGQLLIVMIALIVSFVAVQVCKVQQRSWTLFISGAAAGLSLVMVLERIPF